MRDFSIPIGNERVVRPGVYTTSNDRAMVPPRGNPARRLLIVDVARGGEVGRVTTVSSASEVTTKLVGGSGAQLCSIALRRGISSVDFVRVNKATPATADLGDVVLTARGYGLQGRALQYRRMTSTSRPDAVDLIITDTRTGRTESYPNLGPVLDVRYGGIGSDPKVQVAVEGDLTTVSLSATGGAASDTMSFTSDTSLSIQALADALNNTGAWSARTVGTPAAAAAPLTELKPGPATATGDVVTLSLGGAAIVHALEGSDLVSAELASGEATPPSPEYVFFKDGSEGGAVTVQDWADALEVTEGSDAYAVVIGSGDQAVLSMAVAQAERLSGVRRRRERVVWGGPSYAATKPALKAAALNLAATLGNSRFVVLTDQGKDYDVVTGREVKVGPAAFAADAAATYLTGPVAQNLTARPCRIPKRDFDWGDDDVDEFLNSGVVPVAVDLDDNVPRYVQGLTSYTDDANVMRRKISGVGIRDYLAQKIRVRLKRFIGVPGDETTVSEIVTEVAGVLNEETRQSLNPTGVLTAGNNPITGAPEPAWKNLVAVMDGFDLVGVAFDCHPVGEVAYIHADATFTPVTIRASA